MKIEVRDGIIYDWDRDEFREVEVLDRNGSLVYVEDKETGETEWIGKAQME